MDAKVNFNKGDLLSGEQAMQLAMDVALTGAPFVSPNPVVGCVVVDHHHRLLATGFHAKYGYDHAEIDALKKLSEAEIRDSIFYVTLEPCAHEGRTGSCAKKIATLPVHKVVYGIQDPNPLVNGQGVAILEKAGIITEEYQGPLKEDLFQLCEIFLKNFIQKKVFIAAKVATSLDGQIALRTGESKWITSPSSREFVHELRSHYDAILVGANTIVQDDPSLNIRHPKIQKSGKIIILDAENSIFEKECKIFKIHQKENILFAVRKSNPRNPYKQIEFTDLLQLTEKFWVEGLRSLFIEGGAHTYSSFLSAGLVDRIFVFMAPSIIGAKNGLAWTSHLGIDSLSKKIEFSQLKVKIIGSDLFMTARMSQS
ncbi:MAG: riboflavin biosynthesis protein RibD [Bdellovibrionales bacterium RIFCSPHIGHO2_01_FULL_40_29]|nr:MAG: riboflavin biosynthesis protein RibD [Bdellovibrionales bacterium RIFCSPHIGHO2_01_FULL_40_29]OFZ35108.1 MAG: riboflavin biosynthesis protein RibD [Bdellovibrionales bacterium RIFCSPHIGHO2_02_FULL_40_15]